MVPKCLPSLAPPKREHVEWSYLSYREMAPQTSLSFFLMAFGVKFRV